MSNLTQRVLVAVVGIPAVLLVSTNGGWWLFGFVIALQILLLWEWTRMSNANGVRPAYLPAALVCLAMDFAMTGVLGIKGLSALAACTGLMLLAEIFRIFRRPLANLGSSALFVIYIALPTSLWQFFVREPTNERFGTIGVLAVLFISVWACDSAAYFTGKLWGRHPLYLAASPSKTVEGTIGGLIAACLVLPVLTGLGIAKPIASDFWVLPLIVGGAGQAGDLLESLMKREIGLKDISAFLPGHGGLLDRFDSILLATPFMVAYLGWTSFHF